MSMPTKLPRIDSSNGELRSLHHPIITWTPFLDFTFDEKYHDETKNSAPVSILSNLKTDDLYIRGLILYEVLQMTDIFKAYRRFCFGLGSLKETDNKQISFPEYEFWFLKFQRKEYDMDCETPNFNTQKKLSDMPATVVREIFQHFSFYQLRRLRQVTRPLRYYVDNWNPQVKSLRIRIANRECSIDYDGKRKDYTELSRFRYYSDAEILAADLEGLLKNPKLKLEKFIFCPNHQNMVRKMLPLFKSLENQIHVTHFSHCGAFLQNSEVILRSFKPKVLEEIHVDYSQNRLNINKVFKTKKWAELEQWKQAKVLRMDKQLASVTMESLRNFEKFQILVKAISGKEIALLRNILFNSAHFQFGTIKIAQPLHLKSFLKWLGIENSGLNFPVVLISESEKSMGKFQIKLKTNEIVMNWRTEEKSFED